MLLKASLILSLSVILTSIVSPVLAEPYDPTCDPNSTQYYPPFCPGDGLGALEDPVIERSYSGRLVQSVEQLNRAMEDQPDMVGVINVSSEPETLEVYYRDSSGRRRRDTIFLDVNHYATLSAPTGETQFSDRERVRVELLNPNVRKRYVYLNGGTGLFWVAVQDDIS